MDDDGIGRQVRTIIDRFGGRFSSQVDIDVDDGDEEIERWFLASTLFGNRIDSTIAVRTYQVLDGLGLSSIDDVAACDRDELVEFLDRGGYVRYDYRMAARLLALAENAERVLPDGVTALGSRCTDPERLRVVLESLPGWGPVTTRTFLRELRGSWPGADLSVDPLAARAARHMGIGHDGDAFDVEELRHCASAASVDVRDLEAALVRVAHAHHRSFDMCESRSPVRCEMLEPGTSRRRPSPRNDSDHHRRVVQIDSRHRSLPHRHI